MAALVVAGASTLAAGLVVVADSAHSGSPELEPDLLVQRPYELYVAKGANEVRLRVSNTVANTGTGPLEITGDGTLCDDGEGRVTMQRVYEDSADPGSIGHFIRGEDEDFADRAAGCSRYHPEHDHWHFDNFARYRLSARRRARSSAGRGRSRSV